MKILVLGSGVIGMTTAYALGRAGHEVVVIDRADVTASQASHANGAQLAYSYSEPFASPATFRKLPKYLLGKDVGIGISPTMNPAFYRWGFAFIRNCSAPKETANLHAMLRLAAKSLAAMQTLEKELVNGVITGGHIGKIILTKTQSELDSFGALVGLKSEYGLPVEIIGKQACIDIEPALAHWKGEFCGGLYAKGDRVLDPVVFCNALQKDGIKNFSIRYKFGHEITKLTIDGGKITGVLTDKGAIHGEAVILCLGNEANELLKPLRRSQNIYPMQGYSLTLPLGPNPPQTTSITDPINKLVFANLGDKIRIAGLLDANLPKTKVKARGQHLLQTAKRLWPNAADYDFRPNAFWIGQRPTTPSSLPIVRQSKIGGLYYNIGHGSLGLTLAAGCAEKITELISAKHS